MITTHEVTHTCRGIHGRHHFLHQYVLSCENEVVLACVYETNTQSVAVAMVISELYYMFSAIWQQKAYTGYAYMVAAYAMLLVAVSCASMLMEYMRLESDMQEWCWTSLQPAWIVTGLVMMFCGYFYTYCSPLTARDFASYFVFSGLVSSAMGIGVGACSFLAVGWLVHKLYR